MNSLVIAGALILSLSKGERAAIQKSEFRQTVRWIASSASPSRNDANTQAEQMP